MVATGIEIISEAQCLDNSTDPCWHHHRKKVGQNIPHDIVAVFSLRRDFIYLLDYHDRENWEDGIG